MKEVFEKIMDDLSDLHEMYINQCGVVGSNIGASAVSRCKEIIENAVEQYKGGWIPVSERLPELTEGTECFKQSPVCLTTLKWWDGDMTESIGWYNQSGVWNEDSKNCKVIAWQPLPEPYKGE